MKRIYIILMALLIKASFNKIQGTYFLYNFFPFSDLKMHWPEYAWHLTFYICMCALAWNYYFQENVYKLEMLTFAIIMTGELLDFVLRCNMSWFQIRTPWLQYAFSYDSFIFIAFGFMVGRKQYFEWRSSLS